MAYLDLDGLTRFKGKNDAAYAAATATSANLAEVSDWAKVDLTNVFEEGFYYSYPAHEKTTNTNQAGATVAFWKGDRFLLTTPGDNAAVTAFYVYDDDTYGTIVAKQGTQATNTQFTAEKNGVMYLNMAKTYTPLVYLRKFEPQATTNKINELSERVGVLENGTHPAVEWINFGIGAYDGAMNPNSKRLRTEKKLPKWATKIIANTGYEFGVFAYNNSAYVGWWDGTQWSTSALTWKKSVVVVNDMTKDSYDIFVVCKNTGNTDILPSAGSNIVIYSAESEQEIGVDYVLGADLLRKRITLEKLGVLTYGQSFLYYDNKYYSTDGSHIGVQDNEFDAVDSATLSLGHGNGFCLGSNGVGYVSGWDNNKVYAVDLSTLTITDTIDLPVDGYTTCAVDDVNELIYIFYRSSYPSTAEQYDFIVYDYANEQTLSTKKLSVPFAAMQACDIYHDRIIVIYGSGTTSAPNGYLVLDTEGNILSEYVIKTYAAVEPEGVCIDRDTHEMLISYGQSGDLYRVSES